MTEAREPELMNFGQLRHYITELKSSGYNVVAMRSACIARSRFHS